MYALINSNLNPIHYYRMIKNKDKEIQSQRSAFCQSTDYIENQSDNQEFDTKKSFYNISITQLVLVISPSDLKGRLINLPSCSLLDYVSPLLVTKINPMAVMTFLSKHFRSVLSISSVDLNKVKITLDPIKNANKCISSKLLKSNGYNYSIPRSLL